MSLMGLMLETHSARRPLDRMCRFSSPTSQHFFIYVWNTLFLVVSFIHLCSLENCFLLASVYTSPRLSSYLLVSTGGYLTATASLYQFVTFHLHIIKTLVYYVYLTPFLTIVEWLELFGIYPRFRSSFLLPTHCRY